MNYHDDFSPSNLRRLRNRAKAEIGYTAEIQAEVKAIVSGWTEDEFDRYCDTVPYQYVSVEGATEDEYYTSLLAHCRNELEHYRALKAYLQATEAP